MSLVPMLFSHWWEKLDSPHQLFDQNFGIDLNMEDLLDTLPSSDQIVIYRPGRRSFQKRYRPYLRRGQGTSVVDSDKSKFKITLDVQQFQPNEINVKVIDKNVIVEAKHQEKEDEHGWISREFRRKYTIPNQCDLDKVETFLSSDGVLTITVPRKQDQIESNERRIQIQFTGQPAVRQSQQQSISNGSAGTIENQKQNQKIPNTPQRGRKSNAKST
ncbi:protein lethal(2)essential for life-like [Leptopilina boulardi]|uniref:protein lethal(2)essential for life-like n=1 Tax=Leptopilina boulardi TaxID=63433 RepID=UPI0021F5EDEC|nr:protein lethal(2)essential for life-like [Leptopilina boulardi]